MRSSVPKSVFTSLAGLSLVGAVAGCAPAVQQPATQQPAESPAGTQPSAATSQYKDGTYSADGNYVSPNGTETVGVELTLSDGEVSDVNITTHPSSANTRKFQGEFAGGIKAQIVGKKLDELNVSKVAGSSLTSGGFKQAVDNIKTQAQ